MNECIGLCILLCLVLFSEEVGHGAVTTELHVKTRSMSKIPDSCSPRQMTSTAGTHENQVSTVIY